MTKATDTYLEEYEILIAFPLQQRLRECSSVLCYTDMACVLHTGIDTIRPPGLTCICLNVFSYSRQKYMI
jgi:hypothetical protein